MSSTKKSEKPQQSTGKDQGHPKYRPIFLFNNGKSRGQIHVDMPEDVKEVSYAEIMGLIHDLEKEITGIHQNNTFWIDKSAAKLIKM